MVLHKMLLQLLVLISITITLPKLVLAAHQPLPADCQRKCGDVNIPYPFGTTLNCSRGLPFLVSCVVDSRNTKPFLKGSSVQITNISPIDGELGTVRPVSMKCNGDDSGRTDSFLQLGELYTASEKRNKFTVVGCNSFGYIRGTTVDGKRNYISGCTSLCYDKSNVMNGTCSGNGCCQISIPKGLKTLNLSAYNFNPPFNQNVYDYSPCTYSFVTEASYNFSTFDLKKLKDKIYVPMIIDWVIDNVTCQDTHSRNDTSYACKENSECDNADNRVGYKCKCSYGFKGNPYLQNGCEDINECELGLHNCQKNDYCFNTLGHFECRCPDGYHGNGTTEEGCDADQAKDRSKLVISITIGAGVGVILLLMFAYFLYLASKKRKLVKLRHKFFQQNGGLMLQQQLKALGGYSESTKIFTAEELEKATNWYDERRVVGKGGYGTVYKGILAPDNKVVAIKKSNLIDKSQIEQFINEVAVLTQINHRNVVKILGCCLETEVPLLVYEFVSNGTVFYHIHEKTLHLSWETRLRIAAETAGVLGYLHSSASIPIIHRDVKSTNILLDENYVAKVADFGASRLVPLDQSVISTLVQGTLGYLDPEYMRKGQLIEKSDVYSFGVVLVELLTGRKPVLYDMPEEKRWLANFFLASIKEDCLFQILADVSKEANPEQVQEVANIAQKCLSVKGEERPTMKEVAMELEKIRVMGKQKHSRSNSDTNP